MTFLNSGTGKEPCVQIHEPVEDISNSNHRTPCLGMYTYCYVFGSDPGFVCVPGVFDRSLACWPHRNELCFDETVY